MNPEREIHLNEIARLRAENAELTEKVTQLEKLFIGPQPLPAELDLSPSEELLVSFLFKHDQATKDQIIHALYAFRDGPPGDNIISVWVSLARRKLSQHGIEIKTIWGRGFYMPEESKTILRNMIAA